MVTLRGDAIVPEFLAILEEYVATRYGLGRRLRPPEAARPRGPLPPNSMRRCITGR